jgi:hypothetical protein
MALAVVAGFALRFGLADANLTPVSPYHCFTWVRPTVWALVVFVVGAPLLVAMSKWRSNAFVLTGMAAFGVLLAASILTYTATLPCSPM